MNTVYFVTKNEYKFNELKKVLDNYDIKLEQIPEDTVEIQADSCEEVAGFSAKSSANKYGKPVVKADFGFFIDCFNGFPGPYVKYFADKVGIKKFLELINNENNRNAYLSYVITYCEPNKEPVLFSSRIDGTIIHDCDENVKWFSDVFIPKGQKLTLGQMSDEKKDKIFNSAERKFAEWYVKNKSN